MHDFRYKTEVGAHRPTLMSQFDRLTSLCGVAWRGLRVFLVQSFGYCKHTPAVYTGIFRRIREI